MKHVFYIIILSVFILTGCSTVTKSTLTGVGAGMATGAASGAILSQKDKGKAALYTGLTMGLIGGIVGYFSHKGLEKRDERVRKETLFNLDRYEVSTPIGNSSPLDKSSKEVLIITDDPKLLKRLK